MSATPEECSFLPTLQKIAVGEYTAEKFLTAFADSTSDKDVAATLRFVAMREGEHGKAFEKRVMELGGCIEMPKNVAAKQIKLVQSSMSDKEKMEKLGLNRKPKGNDEDDLFDKLNLFKNKASSRQIQTIYHSGCMQILLLVGFGSSDRCIAREIPGRGAIKWQDATRMLLPGVRERSHKSPFCICSCWRNCCTA